MNVLDYPIPSPAESKGGASGAALAALDWSRAQGPASSPPPPEPLGVQGCRHQVSSLGISATSTQTSSVGWRVGGG